MIRLSLQLAINYIPLYPPSKGDFLNFPPLEGGQGGMFILNLINKTIAINFAKVNTKSSIILTLIILTIQNNKFKIKVTFQHYNFFEREIAMKKALNSLISVVVLVIFSYVNSFAQTNGKIAGAITDANDNSPLVGANILIVGTTMGAATSMDGSFYIINVPPGTYSVRIQMMGYQTVLVENVRVSVNRTVEIHRKLKETTIQGEEVVVTADRITIKKDQTSSIRNVSSEQMDNLPTESVSGVVAMQPGVVLGHFRGGRRNEVTYLIDGIQVDESFTRGRDDDNNRAAQTINLEKDAVEDLEVITGIFSAKYGNAMGGVVNAITKSGGSKFHGSVSSSFANYITPHKDIFIGLKDAEFNRRQDYRASLNGPIYKDHLTFATNIRYQNNKNHLNGIQRFLPTDFSDFTAADSTNWYSEHNGNDEYVPMGWSKNLNYWAKITAKPISSLKLSLQYILNDDESQGYQHGNKYKPDGRSTGYHKSQMVAFQVNHMLSRSAFYELKISYVNNYNGTYVFENPLDDGYIHGRYARSSGGFATGGQDKGHTERWMNDFNAKFDLVWQIHKQHSINTGLSFTHHDLDNRYSDIRNEYYGTGWENYYKTDSLFVDGEFVGTKRNFLFYEPEILPDSTVYSEIYQVQPVEFACYFEDKMEFSEMVVNLGLRFDYFDPRITYPSQWRNPSNQLSFLDNPDKMSSPQDADPKYQFSPRLGISYQLGKTALLRFGYGHFLQMPPLYAMYANHARLVPPNNYATKMGNPQIQAQKTIQYEVGLWQELSSNMSLEVALFYRDIYDLQSAIIMTTYNQIRYGLYSNKDYANARGLEVKYEFLLGPLSSYVNYTLQFSRGNADSPASTFSRAGANQDPVNKLIPMGWDQRHTLNITLGYNKPKYGATLSFYYNSGSPYTWSPLPESPLSRVNLFPNNAHIPNSTTVDLNAYYNLMSYKGMKYRLTLLVYNLFDQLNDSWVNGTTGRAYSAVIRDIDIASHRSNFNDVWDSVHNPAMYSAPRQVKVGLEVLF